MAREPSSRWKVTHSFQVLENTVDKQNWKKTAPKKHEGYQYVAKAATVDKLLKTKHLFWIFLSQVFQPFLATYQTNRPMIPFLASDLEKLLRSIMTKFLKDSVTTSAKTFTQLAKIR